MNAVRLALGQANHDVGSVAVVRPSLRVGLLVCCRAIDKRHGYGSGRLSASFDKLAFRLLFDATMCASRIARDDGKPNR